MSSLTEAMPFAEDRGKRGRRTRKELWMTDESSISSTAFTRDCVDLTVSPDGNLAPGFFFVMLK